VRKLGRTRGNVGSHKRLLETKRNDLLSTCSHRDDIVIEATADEIDRLQQRVTREVAIRHLDNTAKLLKSVQAALDRIEDEIYGVCSLPETNTNRAACPNLDAHIPCPRR
jgi:RNA polymerase-binding transcription factor DksA